MTAIRYFFNRVIPIGVALLIFGLIIFGVYTTLTDKTRQVYSIDQIDYQVVIEQDGSASVTETRTFNFKSGLFTFGWFELAAEATDIRVSENGQPYQRLEDFNQVERPEGFYAAVLQDGQWRVEWYYRTNSPEIRDFQISYTVPDAAIAYDDCVVYFQKYLSESNTTKLGRVTATVELPDGANADNTLIWGHGAGHGTIYFSEDDPRLVELSINKPPKGQYVEARFLMPRDSLSHPATVMAGPMYDEVLDEETKAADQARRELLWSRILSAIAIGAMLALLLWTIWLRRHFVEVFTRYQAAQTPPYYRELPSKVPPLIAAKLFRYYGKPPATSELISTTILDLIYRKILLVVPQVDGRKTEVWLQLAPTESGSYDVLGVEQPVLDFLFRDVAEGRGAVSLTELGKYTKKQRNLTAIQTLVSQFEQKAGFLWNRYAYEEKKKNKVPGVVMIPRLLGLVAAISGFFLMAGSLGPAAGAAGVFLLVGGVINFFLNLILLHKRKMLTQKGEDELALWQALNRFFNEFSTFDEKELPEIGFWEKLLVYAGALGVAATVMKQLQMRYPQLADPNYLYYHYGYFYSMRQMGPDVSSGFGSLQQSIQSSMQSAQSVISRHQASQGGGGGFSGGGSSGGGGAGGSSGGGAG